MSGARLALPEPASSGVTGGRPAHPARPAVMRPSAGAPARTCATYSAVGPSPPAGTTAPPTCGRWPSGRSERAGITPTTSTRRARGMALTAVSSTCPPGSSACSNARGGPAASAARCCPPRQAPLPAGQRRRKHAGRIYPGAGAAIRALSAPCHRPRPVSVARALPVDVARLPDAHCWPAGSGSLPASSARTSPTVRSLLLGSGKGRCAWTR